MGAVPGIDVSLDLLQMQDKRVLVCEKRVLAAGFVPRIAFSNLFSHLFFLLVHFPNAGISRRGCGPRRHVRGYGSVVHADGLAQPQILVTAHCIILIPLRRTDDAARMLIIK